MQHIYLIRHGATLADEQALYCGRSDLALSPQGESALRGLKGKGGYPDPAGMRRIHSGTQRTQRTLEVLFGDGQSEAQPAFREIDYGEFELQNRKSVAGREDHQRWLSGDTARDRYPGGESGEEVAARVRPAFDGLIKDGRDAIVVTHGDIIGLIMTDLYPDGAFSRAEWAGDHGRGWAISFRDGKPFKCEPLPDPFLHEERTLGKKWALVALGFVGLAVCCALLAAYSAMEGTHREVLWFVIAGVLVALSQAIRFKKLRCPYCGKSAAPLKLIGNPRLACPRCGRIYRYQD